MPAFTTRYGLYKPGGGSTGIITPDEIADIDKLNGNFDVIDAALGSASGTSGSRPSSPKDGQIFRESDTGNTVVWSSAGSYWAPVGIPYCGGSATRDAFFPNPKQGDIVYRADLGRLEQYYGLYNDTTNKTGWAVAGWFPVLSTGLNLIKPQSITGSTGTGTPVVVGSDGIIKLSGATQVCLNQIFWQLFDEYVIEVNLVGVTNVAPLFRLRAAGVDKSTASYQYAFVYSTNNGSGASTAKFSGGTSGTSWQLSAGASLNRADLELVLSRPADPAAITSVRATAYGGDSAGGDIYISNAGGSISDPAAYDGLTLIAGAGVMNGTIKVYGRYKGGV